MTVHILMPVFNRLAQTKKILNCLKDQKVDEPLNIIIVDDGSSDGTGAYLSQIDDITVLKGNGSLWWGGAIELGLRLVLELASENDWVLFVNNDTHFNNDFIQCLLDTARDYSPAAVGSVIYDEAEPTQILSIGAVIDTGRLKVQDRLECPSHRDHKEGPYSVDALSGRGTLYPLKAFRMAGTMKPTWLPHYLADYELARRVRKFGFKLLVSGKAVTYSANEWGNQYTSPSLTQRYFSIRSAYYLPAILTFWWSVSSLKERLTLLPRLIFVNCKKNKS